MKQNLQDYVLLDRLSELGEVDPRPMFGGFGLFLEGQFFGLVVGGQAYFKTWPQTLPRYEGLGMQPFQPSPTTRLKTYYQVPPEVARDPRQLCEWARESWQGFR